MADARAMMMILLVILESKEIEKRHAIPMVNMMGKVDEE